MVVTAEWTGTEDDRQVMRKLKLEQVLRRNFSRLTMFGFSSNLMCSWEIIAVSLGLSLANGGTAGLFWTYVITSIGLFFVYSSIAELGSMYPTAGGQYYWVSILAPRKYHQYLSYVTGWLCATQWQTSITAGAFLAGTLIQALFVLNIESYVPHGWHGTLLTLAILTVAIAFNTILARKLPLMEGILVILHILGVVIIIPLWVLSPSRTGGSPLVEFYNAYGWSSNGVATWVGMLSTVSSLIGFDCNVHMAEEIIDSPRNVPYSLLAGYGVNTLLGFIVMMACIYTVGPLDTALMSATGYPFIDMFYAATKSYAATTVVISIIIIDFTAATIAVLATASRQIWAFSRSKGLPFSNFLAPATLRFDIPVNALLVSMIVTIILALINIGSSAALTAIFSIANSSLLTSYSISIACILNHRLRGRPLPEGTFTLGKWGVFFNIASLVYLAPIFVFSFFPGSPNPTLQTMNWGCLMYGALIILSTLYYLVYARHVFIPPTIEYAQDRNSIINSSLAKVESGEVVETKDIMA